MCQSFVSSQRMSWWGPNGPVFVDAIIMVDTLPPSNEHNGAISVIIIPTEVFLSIHICSRTPHIQSVSYNLIQNMTNLPSLLIEEHKLTRVAEEFLTKDDNDQWGVHHHRANLTTLQKSRNSAWSCCSAEWNNAVCACVSLALRKWLINIYTEVKMHFEVPGHCKKKEGSNKSCKVTEKGWTRQMDENWPPPAPPHQPAVKQLRSLCLFVQDSHQPRSGRCGQKEEEIALNLWVIENTYIPLCLQLYLL